MFSDHVFILLVDGVPCLLPLKSVRFWGAEFCGTLYAKIMTTDIRKFGFSASVHCYKM
jgi:hypothetical protein